MAEIGLDMAWWSSISSADLMFIVAVDDVFSVAESAYREAARRIERGLYEPFAWAGFNIEVHACAGDGFLPTAPVPEWNSILPDDLAVQWMRCSDALMGLPATTDLSGIDSGHIMASDSSAPRAHGLVPPMKLSPRWAPLFPAAAIAEGILLRANLRQVYSVISESLIDARRITGTFVLNRTEVVTCSNVLGPWAIRERAPQEHPSAFVVFGWEGLMWLQFDLLASRGLCRRDGCFRPAATLRRGYCETHWLEAGRERDRVRQQRFRDRHRQL